MKRLFALCVALMLSSPTWAEEVDAHAKDRQQLRALLEESTRGINEQNIELLAKHVDETAIVTWLNNEVSHGPQGVRDYFARMVGDGKDAVLSRYTTQTKLGEPARFYGNDLAVANGTMEDTFMPHARGVFNFHSNWTVTLAKKTGEWKIVSLNFSTNTFNNALIDELKQRILMAGAIGLVLGLVLALLLAFGWNKWHRRKPKHD